MHCMHSTSSGLLSAPVLAPDSLVAAGTASLRLQTCTFLLLSRVSLGMDPDMHVHFQMQKPTRWAFCFSMAPDRPIWPS